MRRQSRTKLEILTARHPGLGDRVDAMFAENWRPQDVKRLLESQYGEGLSESALRRYRETQWQERRAMVQHASQCLAARSDLAIGKSQPDFFDPSNYRFIGSASHRATQESGHLASGPSIHPFIAPSGHLASGASAHPLVAALSPRGTANENLRSAGPVERNFPSPAHAAAGSADRRGSRERLIARLLGHPIPPRPARGPTEGAGHPMMVPPERFREMTWPAAASSL